MAKRTFNKLSARTVESKRKAGLYGDGGGLWLQVSPSGSKSWLFRFMLQGRAREMGLGSCRVFSLNEAREKAAAQRKLLAAGVDPIEARDALTAQERLQAAQATTFKQCAEAYIEANRAGWRNSKHAGQWESTLRMYAYPILGPLPVQAIDTGLVQKVLTPIWTKKTETAMRVRGRIEAILDWARVQGQRTGENPAAWRGHLDKLLPKPEKVRKVEHLAALPYVDLPEFLRELRQQEGVGPRALEFSILTAARTGEVIGARPEEFNLESKLWTIPGERMKAGRDHRVPLSPRTVAIVTQMQKLGEGEYLFPGGKAGKPLSNAAMSAVLKRMGRDDITVHGFRSTFRDWAAEQTNFPREVAEAALAHVLKDKTEAAYQRGDLFAKRQKLMEAWARYAETDKAGATVVPMTKGGAKA